MKEKSLEIALVKEACKVCGKEYDGPIVMNTQLSEYKAKEVKDLHGKCIGYMKEPCDDCKELMSKGFVLIGMVSDLTKDPSNPYRSGNIWVVTHEYASRLFQDDKETLEKGVAFIDAVDARSMGFPMEHFN